MARRAEEQGSKLALERGKHVTEQLQTFKQQLERFASKYRTEINKDPEFRRAFAQMTKSIGVDPLSSSKGFWAESLGVGDWYYELGVQIVDVCIRTRPLNGGLILIQELVDRINKMRAATRERGNIVTDGDVDRALEKLGDLGGGYRIIKIGQQKFVVSAPGELDNDTTAVLQRVSDPSGTSSKSGSGSSSSAVGGYGFSSVSDCRAAFGWDEGRARRVLDGMLKDGVTWIDTQGHDGVVRYHFPAIAFGAGGAATASSASSAATRGAGSS